MPLYMATDDYPTFQGANVKADADTDFNAKLRQINENFAPSPTANLDAQNEQDFQTKLSTVAPDLAAASPAAVASPAATEPPVPLTPPASAPSAASPLPDFPAAPTLAPPTAPQPAQRGNLVPDQFNSGLSYEDALAACGPVAAVALSRAYGNNIPVQAALDAAKRNGWTQAGGMNGVSNQQHLLEQLGIPTHLSTNPTEQALAQDATSGNPVTISTLKHYYVANDYNPQTHQFFVGQSGLAFKFGGGQWMTLDQIKQQGGGINGALFVDNPTTSTPSIATLAGGDQAFTAAPKDQVPTAAATGQPQSTPNTFEGVTAAAHSVFQDKWDQLTGKAGDTFQSVTDAAHSSFNAAWDKLTNPTPAAPGDILGQITDRAPSAIGKFLTEPQPWMENVIGAQSKQIQGSVGAYNAQGNPVGPLMPQEEQAQARGIATGLSQTLAPEELAARATTTGAGSLAKSGEIAQNLLSDEKGGVGLPGDVPHYGDPTQSEISASIARTNQREADFAYQGVRQRLLSASLAEKPAIAASMTSEQAAKTIQSLDAAPGDDMAARKAIYAVYPDLAPAAVAPAAVPVGDAPQAALAKAQEAADALKARFPQMTEGSFRASGVGQRLAAAEQAVKDATPAAENVRPTTGDAAMLEPEIAATLPQPPPEQPASDLITGLQNMVRGREAPPPAPPAEPPLGQAPVPGEPPAGGGPPSAGDIAWGALAEAKKTLFSLSNFHVGTIAQGQFYGPAGPQGALDFVAAYAKGLVKPGGTAARATGDLAEWFQKAEDAGALKNVGINPETGTAAQGALSPIARTAAQAAGSGITSGSAAYTAAKHGGASDEDALKAGLIAGGVGAALGPTVAMRMHNALWTEAVPLAKVLTFKAAVEGGVSPAEAALFTKNLVGGQNLSAIAGQTGSEIARLTLMAPDWLWSQGRLIGAGAVGTAKSIPGVENLPKMGGKMTGNEQLSRDWLWKSVATGTLVTQALQYALTGHFTDQNTPGKQFQLEIPSDKGGSTTVSLYPGNIQGELDLLATRDPGRFAENRLGVAGVAGNVIANQQYPGSSQKIYPKNAAFPEQAKDVAGYAASRYAPIGLTAPQQQANQGAPVPLIAASLATGLKVGHDRAQPNNSPVVWPWQNQAPVPAVPPRGRAPVPRAPVGRP